MEIKMNYGKNEDALRMEEIKARKRSYKQQVAQLYEDSLKLTNEEQERLKQGLIRYAVTGDILPFFGQERPLFLRVMELRDQYRTAVEEVSTQSTFVEQGASQTVSDEQTTVLENKDSVAHNDNIYNINNNIIYNNKLKENINTPGGRHNYDHDHNHDNDNGEREGLSGEALRAVPCGTSSLCDPKQKQNMANAEKDTTWVEDLIQDEDTTAAERVIKQVEELCHMRCYDYVREEIRVLVDRLGEQLCLLAVERAGRYGGTTWGYIRKIIEDWCRAGITTPEEAMEYCRQFDERKRKSRYPITPRT